MLPKNSNSIQLYIYISFKVYDMDSQACVDPWGGENESYDDDDEDDDVCPKGYVSQIKKEYTY